MVVVIGASKGIGYTVASFYARAGATLVISARSQKTLDEAREGILSELGSSSGPSNVLAVAADISDTKAIGELIEMVIEKYGRLDVVVSNAGIGIPFAEKRKYTCYIDTNKLWAYMSLYYQVFQSENRMTTGGEFWK